MCEQRRELLCDRPVRADVVPSDMPAGTGILRNRTVHADPHIVHDADTERIPQREPVAFADGGIAVTRENV